MASAPLSRVVGQLRRVALLQEADRLTDVQLLESFLVHRDEAAFEALVRRHGPMVLGLTNMEMENLKLKNLLIPYDSARDTYLPSKKQTAPTGSKVLLNPLTP